MGEIKSNRKINHSGKEMVCGWGEGTDTGSTKTSSLRSDLAENLNYIL